MKKNVITFLILAVSYVSNSQTSGVRNNSDQKPSEAYNFNDFKVPLSLSSNLVQAPKVAYLLDDKALLLQKNSTEDILKLFYSEYSSDNSNVDKYLFSYILKIENNEKYVYRFGQTSLIATIIQDLSQQLNKPVFDDIALEQFYENKDFNYAENIIIDSVYTSSVGFHGMYIDVERKSQTDKSKPIEILNVRRGRVFQISDPSNGFLENTDPNMLISNYCKNDINCLQYFTTVYLDAQKKGAFQNQDDEITLYLDDLIIYKDIVQAVGKEIESNKEISKIYDLMGNEKNIDSKNEILIVKYMDGSFEKVFNIE